MNLLLSFLIITATLCAQGVEVATVSTKMLERKSKLPGEFLPYQTVDLHARVTSFVEKVEVDRGSTVKAGQLLVTLSAPEMMAHVAEAEARVLAIDSQKAEAEAKLVAAQSTYERIKTASATPGAIAQNELVLAGKAVDAAKGVIASIESSSKASKASVESLRALLKYLQVTAPFDGVITERWAHPGALVGPGAGAPAPMLRLEQQSRLRLVVAVPETEVGGIVRGAKVPFTAPAFPGETLSGTVARVTKSMDTKTRTMAVELEVANSSGRLAPGMYLEVAWPNRRPKPSLLVPPTAVVTTTERTFVIRVNSGKAEWVNVVRGLPSGDLLEVFGDLAAGDTVVRRATDEIREGSVVAVKR